MPARVSGVQRVVVAAAIIMAGVFAGFALVDDVTLKTIGFALTVGVIADAFLVRMTIVPAVMFLLGERLDGHVRGTTATDTVGLGSTGVRGVRTRSRIWRRARPTGPERRRDRRSEATSGSG